MVTAESIFEVANMEPGDFGRNIVDPDLGDTAQLAAAIAHIQSKVLPAAIAEVALPFTSAAQGNSLPLPDEPLLKRYPTSSQEMRALVNSKLSDLYDATVTSYALSFIDKQISTNQKSYDEDSDSARKTADAQLKKLIDALADIFGIAIGGSTGTTPEPGTYTTLRPASTSVQMEFGF